ncbi:metal ABC transporter ATP-binding protein [Candidatus Uhrbacteria bacterium]|nr:metal ABC transporter ATP-binding protein [Candidatus Uhrbacteria bacterium]
MEHSATFPFNSNHRDFHLHSRAAITVNNLAFSYGDGTPILQNISCSIPSGSVAIIVGPNGSGKTTFLKALLGLIPPTSGSIEVLGLAPSEARPRVGYVPQRFAIDHTFPITVFEFLRFSHPAVPEERIDEYLEHLGMSAMRTARLGSLSGGQLQRTLVIRSVLHSPEILFLDEPASGIDIGGEQTFYDLILHLHKEHANTIVMVSHEIDIVARFADTVLCLNKTLVCHGAPIDVLTPQTLQQLYGKDVSLYQHQEKS